MSIDIILRCIAHLMMLTTTQYLNLHLWLLILEYLVCHQPMALTLCRLLGNHFLNWGIHIILHWIIMPVDPLGMVPLGGGVSNLLVLLTVISLLIFLIVSILIGIHCYHPSLL